MKKKELDRRVELFRKKCELASAATDDADALECIELFPKWAADKAVIEGERLQYNKKLYKCVQEHTTQEGWEPDVTPALWVRVSVEEWPEWSQPQGAADAYAKGDKVSHNGSHWTSDVDANVWEPGVYGWTEIPPNNAE